MMGKLHPDFSIWLHQKWCSNTNRLMMILNLELLEKFDNKNLHLQLCEPPPYAAPWTVAKGKVTKGVSLLVLTVSPLLAQVGIPPPLTAHRRRQSNYQHLNIIL